MKPAIVFASLALVLAVSGCATSGLSGTTTLRSNYDSTVQADGADHTIVNIEAKGKAGDVLQAVSNASLNTKDGSGAERNMAFGANQTNDATRRAESIDSMNAVWSKAFTDFTAAMTQALTQIAGVVGQVRQAESAADVSKVQARTGAATDIVKAVTKPKPEPAAEPTPATEATP